MKKTTTLLLFFAASGLFAQSKGKEHFSFGFWLGAETQSLGIEPLSLQDPDKVYVRPGRPTLGASAGFLAQKKLWKGWSFKPELGISYCQNQMDFKADGGRRYHFWDLELPLHLVFSDPRRQAPPLRGCVLFGGRLSWNLAAADRSLLSMGQERAALDIGLGAEIRCGKWRARPVFVYSHCLNNIHALGDAPYDWLVGRMVRDRLSLRMGFWLGG